MSFLVLVHSLSKVYLQKSHFPSSPWSSSEACAGQNDRVPTYDSFCVASLFLPGICFFLSVVLLDVSAATIFIMLISGRKPDGTSAFQPPPV